MQAGSVAVPLRSEPSFSIVICTDGRAESLRDTLCSLSYLDYERFEVCVVHGPTQDGTRELLDEYTGKVKTAFNPERNLSISRNIGIARADGDVVAFIDDDSVPEPEWLRDLAASFAEPRVGGAGGFVYDHLGTGFQARFMSANRLGRTRSWEVPLTELSYPYTDNYPHVLGTNSTFRREALLEIGGFDEEYEYYLDETDVCARLVDGGWIIDTITGAYVHHKFLPSSTRTVERSYRILRTWYSIVKNKIYFSLKNRTKRFGVNEIIDDAHDFIEEQERDMNWLISEGLLSPDVRERFWREVDAAWLTGLRRGLMGERRLITQETLDWWAQPFLLFPRTVPSGGRRTFCFVSQEYTQGKMGGIGRYTHELAGSIATMGHHVHVIARADAEGHDCVDFEQGVWVHRYLDQPARRPQPANLRVPDHIWNRAVTVARVLDSINEKRPITAVCAPTWDVEGLAVLADGKYSLVTALVTSMAPFIASNPTLAKNRDFVRGTVMPMTEAEKYVMRESPRIIVPSQAIMDEMVEMYHISFAPEQILRIPYAEGDWSGLPYEAPEDLPPGCLRVVFVGRIEERKGVEVLLRAAKRVLARHPHVYLDLVGNDTIPGPGGRTFREIWENDRDADAVRDRVRFHGAVSDEQLRGFYRACDIFVAPSRFESFGLILVEAMMFSKPTVGCRAGGMVEVTEDGVTGFLADPDDQASLEACFDQLIQDSHLRARMGAAGRKRFETYFDANRVAERLVTAFVNLAEQESGKRRTAVISDTPLAIGASLDGTDVPRCVARSETTQASARKRVTIVTPMIAHNDAISAAVRDTYKMLASANDLDVSVLTLRNDFEDVPVEMVANLTSLLVHPAYLAADILVYHFGLYNELFDALIVGNGHARQIVEFHNITPLKFASNTQQVEEITQSFRQIVHFESVDEIWTPSDVNRETLATLDIKGGHIVTIPLVVESPAVTSLTGKATGRTELIFIGRAVKSKGLLDLVQALDRMRCQTSRPLRLRIAGSLEWSDKAYLDKVIEYVEDHGLRDVVELCGTVSDRERDSLYAEAHILAMPSYHEGFCKPVVEGLRAGCIPVGYASYNLPNITNGLGLLVPPGDIDALASAFARVAQGIAQAEEQPDAAVLPLDRGTLSLRTFDAERLSYVSQFTFDRLAAMTQSRVRALLAASTTPRVTKECDRGGQMKTQMQTALARVSPAPQDEHEVYQPPSSEDFTAVIFRNPEVLMEPQERLMLYALIVSLQPKNALEVGVCDGGSSKIMVRAMDDINRGRLYSIDPEPRVTPELLQSLGHRMTLKRGFSPQDVAELRAQAGTGFDFAFIDGDHGYDSVVRDIRGVLEYLSDSAYLLFHDSHYADVRMAIDACVAENPRQLQDCGLICRTSVWEADRSARWGGLRLLLFVRRGFQGI